MKKRKLKKLLHITLYTLWGLTTISLFLYFSTKFIHKTWGYINIPQVLLHTTVDVNLTYMTPKAWLTMLSYVFYFLITTGILFYFIRVSLRGKKISDMTTKLGHSILCILRFFDKPILICALLMIGVSVHSLLRFDHRIHLWDYINRGDSSFFSDNYYKLDIKNAESKNKNLIVIFLESIEDGYTDEHVYGKNLIPELEALKKDGISFKNYQKTVGAQYTLDALCAQLLGVPIIQMPFDIHNGNFSFSAMLKGTPSVFNLLQNLSYETTAFCGTAQNFTQQDKFLEVHGFDAFWGKEYWEKNGWPQNETNKGNWGYNDEFLYERLKDYLKTKSKNDKFAVLFETIDTHMPNGYTPAHEKHFNDGRDSVMRLSRLTGNFIAWAKEQPWYKNTTIVLVGDHPWQDFKDGSLTQFSLKSTNRDIFNVILNSDIKPKREVFAWSNMDMAPTILHAMGIQFKSRDLKLGTSKNQIGVGVSLLSEEKTLLEKYGVQFFNTEMNKTNQFYDSLYQ